VRKIRGSGFSYPASEETTTASNEAARPSPPRRPLEAVVPVRDHREAKARPAQALEGRGDLRVDLPGVGAREAVVELGGGEGARTGELEALGDPLGEAPPPAAGALGVGGEAVARAVGAAGELGPDLGDHAGELVRRSGEAVSAEDLGVELAQARGVDQDAGGVEGEHAERARRPRFGALRRPGRPGHGRPRLRATSRSLAPSPSRSRYRSLR
jgi:hypothetical protein